jgi:hypothetical protein
MVKTFHVKNLDRFQHYKDRAPPWIKLYNELLDDYEFGLLPDASKWHLIAIWLLASRSANKIPYDPTWVGRRINAASKVDLDSLVRAGFLVVDQELHNAEQIASTVLAECLPRERVELEEERETEACAVAVATRTPPRDYFQEFWKAYPRRDGANPKEPARKLFLAAVKAGARPEDIVAGAARCAEKERKNVGTEFIPQAVKWLRDKRWQDYPASEMNGASAAIAITPESEGWRPWRAHYAATGRSYAVSEMDRIAATCGSWTVPSALPPEAQH